MQDYSLRDVARILKVSPRRLRYWQKTRLVDPGAQAEAADGYAFRDLVCLRTIVLLLEKGVPLQRIRRSLDWLREHHPHVEDPVAALQLLDEEPERLVVRSDGRLEETGGQLLLGFEGSDAGGDGTRSSGSEIAVLAEASRSLPAANASSPPARGDCEKVSPPTTQAVAWFERGCELDGEPAQWDAAIEAYEMAIRLVPDYADAYCNLGAVYYNKGDRREARRAFALCLGHDAEHREANFNLANVLEEEGDDDLALAHYRRALKSDPLYPDLHVNLALLYEKLDRSRAANQHWRRYLRLDPNGTWSEVARSRMNSRGGSPASHPHSGSSDSEESGDSRGPE